MRAMYVFNYIYVFISRDVVHTKRWWRGAICLQRAASWCQVSHVRHLHARTHTFMYTHVYIHTYAHVHTHVGTIDAYIAHLYTHTHT